jgi:hypothetical protein
MCDVVKKASSATKPIKPRKKRRNGLPPMFFKGDLKTAKPIIATPKTLRKKTTSKELIVWLESLAKAPIMAKRREEISIYLTPSSILKFIFIGGIITYM